MPANYPLPTADLQSLGFAPKPLERLDALIRQAVQGMLPRNRLGRQQVVTFHPRLLDARESQGSGQRLDRLNLGPERIGHGLPLGLVRSMQCHPFRRFAQVKKNQRTESSKSVAAPSSKLATPKASKKRSIEYR